MKRIKKFEVYKMKRIKKCEVYKMKRIKKCEVCKMNKIKNKKTKKKESKMKFSLVISWDWLKQFASKLHVESTTLWEISAANLVKFGQEILVLCKYKKWYFFLLINIILIVWCTCFLGHMTHYCVSWWTLDIIVMWQVQYVYPVFAAPLYIYHKLTHHNNIHISSPIDESNSYIILIIMSC